MSIKERIEFFELLQELYFYKDVSLLQKAVKHLCEQCANDPKFMNVEDYAFVLFLENITTFYSQELWERVGKSEIKFWIDNKILRLKSESVKPVHCVE